MEMWSSDVERNFGLRCRKAILPQMLRVPWLRFRHIALVSVLFMPNYWKKTRRYMEERPTPCGQTPGRWYLLAQICLQMNLPHGNVYLQEEFVGDRLSDFPQYLITFFPIGDHTFAEMSVVIVYKKLALCNYTKKNKSKASSTSQKTLGHYRAALSLRKIL